MKLPVKSRYHLPNDTMMWYNHSSSKLQHVEEGCMRVWNLMCLIDGPNRQQKSIPSEQEARVYVVEGPRLWNHISLEIRAQANSKRLHACKNLSCVQLFTQHHQLRFKYAAPKLIITHMKMRCSFPPRWIALVLAANIRGTVPLNLGHARGALWCSFTPVRATCLLEASPNHPRWLIHVLLICSNDSCDSAGAPWGHGTVPSTSHWGTFECQGWMPFPDACNHFEAQFTCIPHPNQCSQWNSINRCANSPFDCSLVGG